MKSFDLFNPMLKECPVINGRYYILVAKGNKDKFSQENISRVEKIEGEYKRISYPNATLTQRKDESNKITKLNLLIYDEGTQSLDWKCTYRNNKGVYFKKHREKYYVG